MKNAPTPAVRFDSVSFTYRRADRPALSDIALEIPRGAFVGVIGRNGAGKSTLVSVINRVVPKPEDVRREFGRRPLPMIVPFPGPLWQERPESAEAYIVELLRQVVGYRVRLR